MQLTAAAVTPPAEHAARRPAGAADAAAADADVRLIGGFNPGYGSHTNIDDDWVTVNCRIPDAGRMRVGRGQNGFSDDW